VFKMAVQVAYRIEGRGPRHRAYNPVKDEQGGIKGECTASYELLNGGLSGFAAPDFRA
jgi:hypothetical protein